MSGPEPLNPPKREHESSLHSSSQHNVIKAKFFNTRNLAIVVSGIVLAIALCRADQKDIPEIVKTIVNSEHVSIIGWVVAVIILVAAIVLIKVMCKIYDREIERLVKERDQLQKELLKRNG